MNFSCGTNMQWFTKSMIKNIIFPQWISGAAVSMLSLQLGLAGGCTSPMLAKLTAPDSPMYLLPEEASWVASLSNMGRFIGAIVGSVCVSLIGPKRAIAVTLIPIALGWLGVAIASSIELLYVARVFTGIGVGMAFSSYPLYIGEIAMPNIRGALISMATCGMTSGQLLASIASSYLELSTSFYIYCGLSISLIFVFLWLPESPHHLIKMGKNDAARDSIGWYRCGRLVDEEMIAVEKFVATEKSITFMDRLREFKKPGIRKAMFRVIALFTFMQICGLNSIIFYMEIILKRAKCSIISAADAVIYVNICSVFAAVAAIFLIDKCGRRFLLLASSSGVTLSMLAMMAHFMLIDKNIDVTELQFLPVASMLVYMVSLFLGLSPVPSTVLSETFPANVKCIAASVASFVGGITAFLSTKTYQPMVDLMGETYVFLVYAICAVLVIPYTLLFQPETKGKTLQQIQDELMEKK